MISVIAGDIIGSPYESGALKGPRVPLRIPLSVDRRADESEPRPRKKRKEEQSSEKSLPFC